MINYVRNELYNFTRNFIINAKLFLYTLEDMNELLVHYLYFSQSLSITHLLCVLLIIITLNKIRRNRGNGGGRRVVVMKLII